MLNSCHLLASSSSLNDFIVLMITRACAIKITFHGNLKKRSPRKFIVCTPTDYIYMQPPRRPAVPRGQSRNLFFFPINSTDPTSAKNFSFLWSQASSDIWVLIFLPHDFIGSIESRIMPNDDTNRLVGRWQDGLLAQLGELMCATPTCLVTRQLILSGPMPSLTTTHASVILSFPWAGCSIARLFVLSTWVVCVMSNQEIQSKIYDVFGIVCSSSVIDYWLVSII